MLGSTWRSDRLHLWGWVCLPRLVALYLEAGGVIVEVALVVRVILTEEDPGRELQDRHILALIHRHRLVGTCQVPAQATFRMSHTVLIVKIGEDELQ